MNKRQIYYFNILKEHVAKKRGKCLSDEYINNYTKLKFQCGEGHIWMIRPNTIISKGGWCLECKREEENRFYLNKLKIFMIEKGGKCLSDIYINNHTKLEFQCDKGHIWKAEPKAIINSGKWCQICNIDNQRNNIDDIIEIAKNRGGKLLTKVYKNNRQKLEFECAEGHIWFVNYSNLKNGTWCSTCADLNHRLTYKERLNAFNLIKKIVEEKGGKCLSVLEEYRNIISKLEFQCNKGHKWKTSASCIKRNHWCSICGQSISEKIFRIIMEKVFNTTFSSCRPDWLRNKYGNRLQIDGYNENLKIGFEYQGKQHFKFSPHFCRNIETFKRGKQNDLTKKQILSSRNIFMFYPTYQLKKENYLEFIFSKIKNTQHENFINQNLKININKLYQFL